VTSGVLQDEFETNENKESTLLSESPSTSKVISQVSLKTKFNMKVENEDSKEIIGQIDNDKLMLVKLEKEDLVEYCETKIKYFLDLVMRLTSMKSVLGSLNLVWV
jgi:hypothetical protein